MKVCFEILQVAMADINLLNVCRTAFKILNNVHRSRYCLTFCVRKFSVSICVFVVEKTIEVFSVDNKISKCSVQAKSNFSKCVAMRERTQIISITKQFLEA